VRRHPARHALDIAARSRQVEKQRRGGYGLNGSPDHLAVLSPHAITGLLDEIH
jgi:hypothetical protein